MARQDTDPRVTLLKTFLSVFFVLAAADVAMQVLYTDFWLQPVNLQMRLGVAGYEILVLFIVASLLSIPAWLLQRCGLNRTGQLVFFAMTLPTIILLLLGWSFYGQFNRFIGSFAVQMFLQDGGQLIKFVGKMPSSVDSRIVSIGAAVAALTVIIVHTHFRPVQVLRTFFSTAGVAALMMAVAGSILWNMPSKAPQFTAQASTITLQRLKDSKFQLLVNRAGPFTELASSLTKTVFSQKKSFSIDTARLEKITENSRQPSDRKLNKYNVVFVLVESLHPNVLQAFGSTENIMPTVNKLSENAYILDNVWAQASHSNYADVSVISGQYPLRSMNIHFYPDTPDYPKSLPYDRLEPFGYKTGLFSSQNENWGLMENYLKSDSIDAFTHVGSDKSDITAVYRGIKVDSIEGGKKKINYSEFMFQGSGNGIERLDGETTDDALAWMSSLEADDPIFLYFNYQASHVPFNALPENFERQFLTETNESVDKIKAGNILGQPLNNIVEAYKDSLYYVDQNIARVINFMKKTGRHQNTIYVITADTAIRFNGELMGNGGALWSDVLRVPVVISVPGADGRTNITEPLEQIDLMPTVLGIIGTGPHPASQGVDFLNTKNDPERIAFAVAQTPVAHQYSAIYKDWQLRHDFLSHEQTLHYVGDATDTASIPQLSDTKVQWLVEQLREWRLAQIGYYTVPQAHSLYYPPKFNSEKWKSKSAGTLLGESDVD